MENLHLSAEKSAHLEQMVQIGGSQKDRALLGYERIRTGRDCILQCLVTEGIKREIEGKGRGPCHRMAGSLVCQSRTVWESTAAAGREAPPLVVVRQRRAGLGSWDWDKKISFSGLLVLQQPCCRVNFFISGPGFTGVLLSDGATSWEAFVF